MIRNSIIYRRIWYMKRRNSKRLYVYSRLLSIVIIFALLAFYAENYSIPYIIASTEQKLKNIIQVEANNAIFEIISAEESKGTSESTGEAKGQLSSISNSKAKYEELSWKVHRRLEEKLGFLNKQGLMIPMGALLGDTKLAEAGPLIQLESRIIDEINSQVTYDASDKEGMSDKHQMYIYVQFKAGVKVLLNERELGIKTYLPISDNLFQSS